MREPTTDEILEETARELCDSETPLDGATKFDWRACERHREEARRLLDAE